MKIYCWGSRGSLPYSVTRKETENKIREVLFRFAESGEKSRGDIDLFIKNELGFEQKGTYGSNTPCVEIKGKEAGFICDAGTGIRDCGLWYAANKDKIPGEFNIFISHLHWDHIHGFPFFAPAFLPGVKINFYGLHTQMEEAFRTQQSEPFFPVSVSDLPADITFTVLQPDRDYEISGITFRAIEQDHPGRSYGFSFVSGNKKFVYSTDCEHKKENKTDLKRFTRFFNNADLLVMDAQYRLVEAIDTKYNWGHSSNLTAVEYAAKSECKNLWLFHNEHTYNDRELKEFYDETLKYREINFPDIPLRIETAYDGLSLVL